MNYLTLLVSAYLAFAANNFQSYRVEPALWESFKLEHGKSYDSPQVELLRKVIFAQNLQKIAEFNSQEKEAAQYFELAPNALADLSDLEIKQRNGYKKTSTDQSQGHQLRNTPEAELFLRKLLDSVSDSELPAEVDWRQVPNRVTEVKDQGQCGSCWAFASTGALEGQEKAQLLGASANASLVELSEQNLVDCVKADAGCGGGLMSDAFDYIKAEGGIEDERSYPYEARTRECRFNKAKSVMFDAGHAMLPPGDEQALKKAVATFGPVAVAIDASSLWFSFYRHGVYVNRLCKNKENQLDHGVLVVGYGTDPKKGDYWLVKNSWGKRWGEKGYIRMARNRRNQCGIATAATLPTF